MNSSEGNFVHDVFETKFGWVSVIASESGVKRMSLPEPTSTLALAAVFTSLIDVESRLDDLEQVKHQIRDYLSGRSVDLRDIALDLEGTPPFFRRAWNACRSIPYGETRSYSWVAASAGSPLAVRAAGQAMARNPVPLAIPCHRVVGSDGDLYGFAGTAGVTLKSLLINLESRNRRGLIDQFR
mgnify:CR=1 FL=1